MSNYFINGSNVTVGKDDDVSIKKTLPVGTYTVNCDQTGFSLIKIDDFELPDRVYGNADVQTDRILNTFDKRPNGTGVHLDGVKGSGKTLLLKKLSLVGLERGYSTIVINNAFAGDEFNNFIQSIDTPCIVVFDEFEKVYDEDVQEKILTLFDGVYPSKKLYVLTTNNNRDVSEYLKNRPGRMFYKFEYTTLEKDIIREVLEDRLLDKSQIPSVLRYASIFTFINFDMLISIIEEMNRYNETLNDVLKVLNIRGETSNYDKFDFYIDIGGVELIRYKNHRFDLNNFSFHTTNYEIASLMSRQDSSFEEIDFYSDDCPETVVIGTTVLDLENEEHINFSSNNIIGFDEDKHEFRYRHTSNGTDIDFVVRRRDYVQKKPIDLI